MNEIQIFSLFILAIAALLAILGIIQNAPRVVGSSVLVLILYILIRLAT